MHTASQESFALGETERTLPSRQRAAEADALPHLSVGLHNTLA